MSQKCTQMQLYSQNVCLDCSLDIDQVVPNWQYINLVCIDIKLYILYRLQEDTVYIYDLLLPCWFASMF